MLIPGVFTCTDEPKEEFELRDTIRVFKMYLAKFRGLIGTIFQVLVNGY